jgi:heme exporter protein B
LEKVPDNISPAESDRGEPPRAERAATSRVEPPTPPGFVRATLIVLHKDLLIELRTREIVTTGGFFAALIAVLASVSFYSGADTTARVAPGAIWLAVAFSSILSLGRAWQREREESALLSLLLAPIARGAIFCGKALGVALFMTVVEIIVVPVVALMFHVDLPGVILPLLPILALGTLGVAAMGTLFGAMTVRTRARDLVLATVLFPLLTPTLLSGVAATREIFAAVMTGHAFEISELSDYFLLLGVFDVIAIAGGLGMFGAMLED